MSRRKEQDNPARAALRAAWRTLEQHPALAPLADEVYLSEEETLQKEDWAWIDQEGFLHANSRRRAGEQEWMYIFTLCLLHLGLGHFREERMRDPLWIIACDCTAARYAADLHIGTPPDELRNPLADNVRDEEKLFAFLHEHGSRGYLGFSAMGGGRPDMVWNERPRRWGKPPDWQKLLGTGLRSALRAAVNYAGGASEAHDDLPVLFRETQEWFLSSYPLLGGLAVGFRLIADGNAIQRMGIRTAAISCQMQEIYLNPYASYTPEEWKFIFAHEYLHAALRHDERMGGRDPELWNVACDYVINGWLRTMNVGAMPEDVLYDNALDGLSAENVYDLLTQNLRKYRRMAQHDILFPDPGWTSTKEGAELDAWCRNAILRGLEYHESYGRGLLPEGLVEEIRALSQPPIPWDVQLARWFDDRFQPLEKQRTYARLSRRQSATPEIPRPSVRLTEQALAGRTFGVVLDTSGSMERNLLAAALGAIASYAEARDVRYVRVVFCDAAAYDQGYMDVLSIAGSVRVRGRGGTVLQPAVELLEHAPDFPKEAPLLLITDGYCDRLTLYGRDHAYLVPKGRTLPFPPKGPVFYLQ